MKARTSSRPFSHGFIAVAVALLASTVLVAPSSGQDTVAPIYPRLDVTPVNPTSQDSVVVRLVKGVAGNSCMAPTYSDIGFSVDLGFRECTPGTPGSCVVGVSTVYVRYREIPIGDRKCPLIYAPVEYGPAFALGRLPYGEYMVVDGNDTVGSFWVAISPPTGLSISGTVIADPGVLDVYRPLAGVRVSLGWLPAQSTHDDSITQFLFPARTTIDTVRTDSAGHFAFHNLTEGNYVVLTSSRDYQMQKVLLTLRADTSIELRLLPTNAYGYVSGTVREACPPGTACLWLPPIPGCTVEVSILYPRFAQLNLPPPEPTESYLKSLRTVTDSAGRYTVRVPLSSVLAPAEYRVTASKAGFMTQTARADVQYMTTTRVDFALVRIRTATLSGVVTDDPGLTRRVSMPLEGVVLYLTNLQPVVYDSVSGRTESAYYYQQRITGVDGAFRFTDVPPGTYRLTLEKKGYNPQTRRLAIDGDTMLGLSMVPAGTLTSVRGTVQSARCPVVSPNVDGPCLVSPLAYSRVMVVLDVDCWDYAVQAAGAALKADGLCMWYQALADSAGQYVIDSIPLSYSGQPILAVAALEGYQTESRQAELQYMVPTVVYLNLSSLTVPVAERQPAAVVARAASIHERTLTLSLPTAQRVLFELYRLDGRRVGGACFERPMAAGVAHVPLALPSALGAYLALVKGEGWSWKAKISTRRQ